MGQAIVVYETSELLITIDSDELEQMTTAEIDEIISEARGVDATGQSEFFSEISYGPNPKPVRRS